MNRREFLLGALSLEAVPSVAFAKSAADATSGRLRIAHMTDLQLEATGSDMVTTVNYHSSGSL